jgi:hypothetical protein
MLMRIMDSPKQFTNQRAENHEGHHLECDAGDDKVIADVQLRSTNSFRCIRSGCNTAADCLQDQTEYVAWNENPSIHVRWQPPELWPDRFRNVIQGKVYARVDKGRAEDYCNYVDFEGLR